MKVSYVFAFAALAASLSTTAVISVADEPADFTIPLAKTGPSGESGTARIVNLGDKTEVAIQLSNAPQGVVQPAHLHEGSCGKLNPAPKYPLNPVVNGYSATILEVPLTTLLASKFAVNIHNAKDDISNYVSCGNVAPKK